MICRHEPVDRLNHVCQRRDGDGAVRVCVGAGEDLVSESSLQTEEVETGKRRVQLVTSPCRCAGSGSRRSSMSRSDLPQYRRR